LNRSEQTKNTKAFSDICGINTSTEIYKSFRLLQIITSNNIQQFYQLTRSAKMLAKTNCYKKISKEGGICFEEVGRE